MYYFLRNQSNTFSVYLGEYVSSCTLNVRDVGTDVTTSVELTPVYQNERYTEFTWTPDIIEGQYILSFYDGASLLCTHNAYISNTSDTLNYNDYEFYEET